MSVLYNDPFTDGSINSREYKSFDIYAVTIKIFFNDWISPLNKLSDFWFILKHQSVGKKSMVNPVPCIFFSPLKHLILHAVEVQIFSGLHIYTL